MSQEISNAALKLDKKTIQLENIDRLLLECFESTEHMEAALASTGPYLASLKRDVLPELVANAKKLDALFSALDRMQSIVIPKVEDNLTKMEAAVEKLERDSLKASTFTRVVSYFSANKNISTSHERLEPPEVQFFYNLFYSFACSRSVFDILQVFDSAELILELTTPRRSIRTESVDLLHVNKPHELNHAALSDNTNVDTLVSLSSQPIEMNGIMMTAETSFIDLEGTNIQDEVTSHSLPETPVAKSSVSARIEALQRLVQEQNLRDSEGGANHSRRKAFLPSGHRMEPQLQETSAPTNSASLYKAQAGSGAI